MKKVDNDDDDTRDGMYSVADKNNNKNNNNSNNNSNKDIPDRESRFRIKNGTQGRELRSGIKIDSK